MFTPLLPSIKPLNILMTYFDISLVMNFQTCAPFMEFSIPGCNAVYQDGKLAVTKWWCSLDHIPSLNENYASQSSHGENSSSIV